jgi:hypothetical protein
VSVWRSLFPCAGYRSPEGAVWGLRQIGPVTQSWRLSEERGVSLPPSQSALASIQSWEGSHSRPSEPQGVLSFLRSESDWFQPPQLGAA